MLHASSFYPIVLNLLAGRAPDNAIAKNQASKPQQAASRPTTAALGDDTVTLASRFPHIVHAGKEEVVSKMESDAEAFVTKTILEAAVGVMSRCQLRTEAARVHVAGAVSS